MIKETFGIMITDQMKADDPMVWVGGLIAQVLKGQGIPVLYKQTGKNKFVFKRKYTSWLEDYTKDESWIDE